MGKGVLIMSANSLGHIFTITSFGESHGEALGVVIDGCPSNVSFDNAILIDFLSRRRPGFSPITSSRKEPDQYKILSGVFNNKTTGSPITIIVNNTNQNSKDYDSIKNKPRNGHADDMWKGKFTNWDHRGGGRSSGRETLSRVIAGAIAKMTLKALNSNVNVQTKITKIFNRNIQGSVLDAETLTLLEKAKKEGRSYGGHIQVHISHVPPYLGQPVFHKFKSDLALAFMSVGAVNGVEFGDGFNATNTEGSEYHTNSDSKHYGGIRGGITTGDDILWKVSFKPPASVLQTAINGRHDPCILPRAQVVLESMAYLVILDHWLWRLKDQV